MNLEEFKLKAKSIENTDQLLNIIGGQSDCNCHCLVPWAKLEPPKGPFHIKNHETGEILKIQEYSELVEFSDKIGTEFFEKGVYTYAMA